MFIASSIRPRRWLALALGMASAVAHATDALTLDQALRLAQARSRQLAAQDSAAAAARDMAVAAAQRPDPTLKAGIVNLPIDGPERFSVARDFMTMRSVGLMQEFTRADKLQARATRFEREAQAAEAARELALANLQRDTAVAWLDRHYRERMRDILVEQRDEARLQIDAADAAYRGGRGAQAEVFAARSAVASIEDRIAQIEREIATATTQLERRVGDAAGQPLAEPPAMDAVRLDPSDLDAVVAHHPEVALLARQEDIARAEAEVARTNKRADWSAELMFNQRGSSYSNMVSINASIPLQWNEDKRQDREIAAKLATAEQMKAQREEASRGHVAEARAMWQEWRSNRDRLARYDATLIPLAAERTRAALAAYRGLGGDLSAVLDARRGEIEMRMERLRLQMDTARVWAELNYLVAARHTVALEKQQ